MFADMCNMHIVANILRRNVLMIDREQLPTQMLLIWKTYWETYMKTLEATEEQGDRMLDLMLQQSDGLREENKKIIKQWIENSKSINKTYIQTVNENIKQMEEILNPKSKEE
jgi:hypothetical protein